MALTSLVKDLQGLSFVHSAAAALHTGLLQACGGAKAGSGWHLCDTERPSWGAQLQRSILTHQPHPQLSVSPRHPLCPAHPLIC